MKYSLQHSISIEQRREASADDVLVVLQQIAKRWPEAVLDRKQPISISELVALPEGRIFIAYRDRTRMFEQKRFDSEPDASSWIRIQWHDDKIIFIVNAWSSASGRLVRQILGIDQ